MVDEFDREKRKSTKSTNTNKQKHKNSISEEDRLLSKAKKAFKNRIQDIIDEETLDEMENYGYKF
jgi:hypothetical protein